MPSSLQAKVTRHWNDRARSYLHNHGRLFNDQTAAERWRRLVAETLGPEPGLRVLDAGCGPGTITRPLAELGHQVTGVDVSSEMLSRARQVLGSKAESVELLEADASHIPLPDQKFDLVICRYLVWTLPDPVKAIHEWKRLLKPGGRLCIIDGNWYYHYYRSGWARWWLRLVDFGHKVRNGFDRSQKLAVSYARDVPATHVFRPDWDMGLLAGAGFVDIQVRRDMGVLPGGSAWPRLSSWLARPFLIQARKPGEAV